MIKKLKFVFVAILSMLLIVAITAPSIVKGFAKETVVQQKDLAKSAKAATLVDFDTGTVVFDKQATNRYPIASMVKIMTLLLVFDTIEGGDLSVNTDIVISENAASMGGSQAFLDANTTYKASELIKSIVVASANDACVALAEHIAGTVDSFVGLMNQKATELGMPDTNFVNCTGLPAHNGYSCAKDVAVMTRAMLRHSLFYNYSTVWSFDFAHNSGRTTTLTNTNKLIRAYNGCDGGKTGFTQEAAYCLSATAKRGNTRLIAVAIGVKDSKTRNAEIAHMLNHGFGNYETRQFVFKDKPIQQVQVGRGKVDTVSIAPQDDFFYFAKKTDKQKIEHEVLFDNVKAPVAKGQQLGTLLLKTGDKKLAQIPLVASSDVCELGFLDILQKAIGSW